MRMGATAGVDLGGEPMTLIPPLVSAAGFAAAALPIVFVLVRGAP
jgi:hypothetical protein